MPALTAYAQSPAHGAGWPPMETIPPTSTSTCSGAASIIAVASPIQTHCHPRASSKPRFPRLAKSIIISSTLQRLNKSKFSSSSNTVCPILPAIPRPHTIIRSILQSKPPPSLIEQGSPSMSRGFVIHSPHSSTQRLTFFLISLCSCVSVWTVPFDSAADQEKGAILGGSRDGNIGELGGRKPTR